MVLTLHRAPHPILLGEPGPRFDSGGEMEEEMITRKTCWLLGVLAALGFASPAGAAEPRCLALDAEGAKCFVSEPLNTNSLQYIPGPTCSGQNDIDWGDSQTKEASRGYNRCTMVVPTPTATNGVGLPTGSSLIQWVQKINPASKNEMVWLTPSSGDTTSRRLCMRVYRRYSPNHTTSPNQCESNKQQEFALTAIQHSNLGGDFFLWAGGMTSPPSGNELSTTGQDFGPSGCSASWCRQEICISASSAANLWNAQGITLEGYVAQVGISNPKRMNYTRTFVGNRLGGGSFKGAEFYPVTGYRGINNCNNASTAGYSYISHVMIASWPTDAGQFIGAANEVEGGGGTTPPPPPAAQPPAAPVLLP